ncbi:hypothetical protein JTE90_027846 [Oedothorax gibbosus]|uniref:T20D4.11-like domain-containing protein n=1 Tax=Oedothorax gibbosus TaxID=931172 RepID=A0AAV6U3C1_9ARAC|nr:hypothetical protein JTE90_027846 [Oedothorax gibbosus]
MNYILVVFFCGVLSVGASPACTEDGLKKCNDLKSHDELDITFPKTKQELKSHCSSEKVPLDCFSDFIDKCPTFIEEPVKEFYVAANKLFGRICDDNGDLQAKYLRNAVCINDIMTNHQEECVEEHEENQEKEACVYQTAVVRCLGNLVAENCGEEALDIMREVYIVMKPMLERCES